MSKLMRERPENEDSWKLARTNRGIGGSEAAAIAGRSSWMTAMELWQYKTGQKERPDISDNPLVAQGHRMEKALRELYKAYHPDRKVRYHEYDLLFQDDRPWLFATLDGEVIDESGRHGVFEAKTSTPMKKTDWDKWNNQIPESYYCQILHEMLASGYEFVDLMACLINQDGDFQVRTYHFERSECIDDMDWLLGKEQEFWNSVQTKTLPKMTLVL